MITKTITYTDLNGVTKTETFYFHLSKNEVIRMYLSEDGGYDQMIKTIVNAKDGRKIIQVFEKFIENSYGIKTPEGGFKKSPEIFEKFKETEAYDQLYMELATNADAGAKFINSLMPKFSESELNKMKEQQIQQKNQINNKQ